MLCSTGSAAVCVPGFFVGALNKLPWAAAGVLPGGAQLLFDPHRWTGLPVTHVNTGLTAVWQARSGSGDLTTQLCWQQRRSTHIGLDSSPSGLLVCRSAISTAGCRVLLPCWLPRHALSTVTACWLLGRGGMLCRDLVPCLVATGLLLRRVSPPAACPLSALIAGALFGSRSPTAAVLCNSACLRVGLPACLLACLLAFGLQLVALWHSTCLP